MPKSPTVSLLDELAEFLPKKGPRCGVGITLGELPAELAAQFQQVLDIDKDRAPHAAVSRLMRSKGYELVTDNAVARHRKGDCSCCK